MTGVQRLNLDGKMASVAEWQNGWLIAKFDDGTVSYLKPTTPKTAEEAGHEFHGNQWTTGTTAGFVKATDAQKKALKLPPAWKDVHINPDPKGALQAVGIDKKGRVQRRYSAEHSQEAAAEKFQRLQAFSKAVPGLRAQVQQDLKSKDPAVKEPAAVINLIDKTGIRIGSDKDTLAEKKAYGASTLEASHVKIDGDDVHLTFPAKKSTIVDRTVTDAALAKELAPRVARGGRLFDTTYHDTLAYMSARAPGFTPKDFRTYKGTAWALRALQDHAAPKTEKEFKTIQREVAKQVASRLGNTPAVSLRSYIDPATFANFKAKKP